MHASMQMCNNSSLKHSHLICTTDFAQIFRTIEFACLHACMLSKELNDRRKNKLVSTICSIPTYLPSEALCPLWTGSGGRIPYVTMILMKDIFFQFIGDYYNIDDTFFLFSFILLIHEGSHREVYKEFQPSYDIFLWWCQGLFRPQVPCSPSLNCPIANSASTQSQQPVQDV